jgi:hypothetical protein
MTVLRRLVLCLALLTCIFGVARADPVVVYNKPVNEFQRVMVTFDVDQKLARAWITVERLDSEFQPTWDYAREKVDGLTYDKATGNVLYQATAQATPIVCAKEMSELGQKRYKPTGDCPLKVSYEKRTVDDGTRPEEKTFAKVTLNPTTKPAKN